jgi:hypothetical protein
MWTLFPTEGRHFVMPGLSVFARTRAFAGVGGDGPRFLLSLRGIRGKRLRVVTFEMGKKDVKELASGVSPIFQLVGAPGEVEGAVIADPASVPAALDAYIMARARAWLSAERKWRRTR